MANVLESITKKRKLLRKCLNRGSVNQGNNSNNNNYKNSYNSCYNRKNCCNYSNNCCDSENLHRQFYCSSSNTNAGKQQQQQQQEQHDTSTSGNRQGLLQQTRQGQQLTKSQQRQDDKQQVQQDKQQLQQNIRQPLQQLQLSNNSNDENCFVNINEASAPVAAASATGRVSASAASAATASVVAVAASVTGSSSVSASASTSDCSYASLSETTATIELKRRCHNSRLLQVRGDSDHSSNNNNNTNTNIKARSCSNIAISNSSSCSFGGSSLDRRSLFYIAMLLAIYCCILVRVSSATATSGRVDNSLDSSIDNNNIMVNNNRNNNRNSNKSRNNASKAEPDAAGLLNNNNLLARTTMTSIMTTMTNATMRTTMTMTTSETTIMMTNKTMMMTPMLTSPATPPSAFQFDIAADNRQRVVVVVVGAEKQHATSRKHRHKLNDNDHVNHDEEAGDDDINEETNVDNKKIHNHQSDDGTYRHGGASGHNDNVHNDGVHNDDVVRDNDDVVHAKDNDIKTNDIDDFDFDDVDGDDDDDNDNHDDDIQMHSRVKRSAANVPDDEDDSSYRDDEYDEYENLINNKSAKGKYVGAPCDNFKCEPTLLHVTCDKETQLCGCEKNYPVQLGIKKGCAKPKKLGEQCFYDKTCIYNDENSLCVQVRHNAMCQCVSGFHSVSYSKPTRRVFCTQDLKELKSDLPTLLGVTSGIAVLAGLICMVLHLFSKTKYPRHRNFGDANLPPPIMYSSETGIPLTVQSGRPSSRSSLRSSGSIGSYGNRRSSMTMHSSSGGGGGGIGGHVGASGSKGILVSTSRTGSRRPSLASVHSTSSSVRSYSMMRFEKETQQKEIRQEMKLRLARLQHQQHMSQNKPQIVIGDALVHHHGALARVNMSTPSPLTPNSLDELLPSVDETQEFPMKIDPSTNAVLAKSASASTASNAAYNGPCSSSTEAL